MQICTSCLAWGLVKNRRKVHDQMFWIFTLYVSKYGVFSGPHFPVFSPNTGKYGPEKTPYLDTSRSVYLPLLWSTINHWSNISWFIQYPAGIYVFKVENRNTSEQFPIFSPKGKNLIPYNSCCLEKGKLFKWFCTWICETNFWKLAGNWAWLLSWLWK